MALLADAGLDTYRFSIEWARIEPEKDWISRAAIDHYRRMVDTARDLGLQPMVTLHHFTNPVWFARDGRVALGCRGRPRSPGTSRPRCPVLDDVELVCTINEPNMVSVLADPEVGFPSAGLPPGVPEVTATLVDAHRRAVEIVRGAGDAGRLVGRRRRPTSPCPAPRRSPPSTAARARTSSSTPRAGDDWVGVQAYTRTRIGRDGPLPIADDAERTLTGWEYYPPAVGDGIRNAWARAARPGLRHRERHRHRRRQPPHRLHARRPARPCARASTTASTCAGICTGARSTTTSGAATGRRSVSSAWDRETFERHPKPSLAWLGEVARANALVRA